MTFGDRELIVERLGEAVLGLLVKQAQERMDRGWPEFEAVMRTVRFLSDGFDWADENRDEWNHELFELVGAKLERRGR